MTQTMKQTMAVFLAAIMGFVLMAPAAEAYTYYYYDYDNDYDYSYRYDRDHYYDYRYSRSSSEEALRQDLIRQIQSLMAQIAALQSRYGYNYYGGRVLGATYGDYDVEVQTFTPTSVYDDYARVSGEVDLNGAPYARVWFEYGESRSMRERSSTARIDNRTSDSFRATLYNLDEDTKYYYRAVAQDPAGHRTYGNTRSFTTDEDDRRRDDDEPDVDTGSAYNVGDDHASFRGEVDMNDFDDGLVFFVYGEDEDQVEDIEDDYDEYRDIDEDGDDLQKFKVDNSLDGEAEYTGSVYGLDDDTEYFYAICVEFEDEDDDEKIICGDTEDFETDD